MSSIERAKSFEKEEILQIKEIFSTFTSKSSTEIPIEEVPQVFKKLGIHRSKSDISKLLLPFQEFQGLDFPNFLLLLSQDISEQGEPGGRAGLTSQFSDIASETFKQMDKDGSGELSPKELKEGMSELFGEEAAAIDIDAMFSKADSNHDGKLDFFEFKNALKSAN